MKWVQVKGSDTLWSLQRHDGCGVALLSWEYHEKAWYAMMANQHGPLRRASLLGMSLDEAKFAVEIMI